MKEIKVEELKQIQINILDEVDAFCRSNNIDYYLSYGTLIGAVRHKGYIPWDDDIDILVQRKDYNKLISEFNKHRNGDVKIIDKSINSSYYHPFAKAVDTSTIMMEELNDACEIGVYIDIFPLDELPNDDKKINQLFWKIKRCRDMITLKTVPIKKDRELYKNIVLFVSQLLLKPISVRSLVAKIDILAQTYNGTKGCSKVGNLTILVYGKREIWEKTDYEYVIELEFEGKKYMAPSGYHAILSKTYGDYMQLPPLEKQISHHHFKAYKK